MSANRALPRGWTLASLGQICTPPQYGWTTRAVSDGSGLPLVRTSDISRGDVDWLALRRCAEDPPDAAKYALVNGDVLVSRAGSVGVSSVIKDPPPLAVFASYLIRFRPHAGVSPEFIGIYMRSQEYWAAIAEQSAGIALPNVNASKLKQLEIPLPPTAEQIRIVRAVAQCDERITSAQRRLDRARELADRLRRAVLDAAFSGALTDGWRVVHTASATAAPLLDDLEARHALEAKGFGGKAAAPSEDVHTLTPEELPAGWALAELKLLCEPGAPITYGILKPGPDVPNGVPYIRVADFPGDAIEIAGIRRTSPKIAAEYKRSELAAHDVLLSIRGTVGRVARVPKGLSGANITQDTVRIRVDRTIDSDYVEWYLRSPTAQRRLAAAMKGVAVRGVNVGDVRALQIPVPSVDEQRQIVRRLRDLLRSVDAIDSRIKTAARKLHRTTDATISQALRGELVRTETDIAETHGRPVASGDDLLAGLERERDGAVLRR